MAQRLIDWKPLNINGSDAIKLSIPSSGTAYVTQPINTRYNNGYSALVAQFVSGTALMNISYQVSLDQQNWFTAATTDGTTLTAVGAIVSSVTASQYIVFTPRPAPFTRFSISMTSTGIWSMYYLQQEDAA